MRKQEDFNTNEGEILNASELLEAETKITVRVEINEVDAEDILQQFRCQFPNVADLDEIHLIIKK